MRARERESTDDLPAPGLRGVGRSVVRPPSYVRAFGRSGVRAFGRSCIHPYVRWARVHENGVSGNERRTTNDERRAQTQTPTLIPQRAARRAQSSSLRLARVTTSVISEILIRLSLIRLRIGTLTATRTVSVTVRPHLGWAA